MVVVVTGGEQNGNKGVSDAVKREITQGLVEGHGVDNGIAVAGAACVYFFDFETCEGIDIRHRWVRCMAC